MQTKFETITPEVAAALLRRNDRNRRINPSRVKTMANDMSSGRWRTNPQPIVVAADGRLLDGQHRSEAVILSGQSIVMAVTRGAPLEVQDVIDRGRARTTADALTIAGFVGGPAIAGAARIVLCYDYHPAAIWNGKMLSSIQVQDFAEANIDALEPLYRRTHVVRRITPIAHSAWIASAFIIARDSDNRARLDDFITEVEGGGGGLNQPTTTLFRTKQLDRWGQGQSNILVVLKVWNAWIQGRELRLLKATRNEVPLPLPL